MFCRNCGNKIDDKKDAVRFCPRCGIKILSLDNDTDNTEKVLNDNNKANDDEIYEDKDATVALGHNVKKASAETVKHVQDVSSPIKLTYFSQENYSSEPKPTPDTAQKNNTPLILMCAGLMLMSVIFGVSAFFLYNKNLPENRYEKSCERSQEFLESGDYEEAIEEARKAIEIYPEKSQGYLLLAKAYYHKGDHEEAVDILSNVPERLKDNKKITELLTKIQEDSLEEETVLADKKFDSKSEAGQEQKIKTGSYKDLENKSKNKSTATMQYISSDVSQYPLVKVYYQVLDSGNTSLTLSSPTAAIKESVAGGAYIEREVKKIEKLEGNQGLSIDIVADKSGSMDQDMPKIQSVLSQFINSLDYNNGDQAEFLAFEDSVMYMCSYTRNSNLLNNGVASLSANGRTALYDACIEGVRNASAQPGAKCVIVFTDGQDNESYYSDMDVINLAVATSVPIYIIGAGDVDSYGLTYIAEQTKGRYWNINDLYDMSGILQSIYTEQKDLYCVEYVTDQSIDAYAQRTTQCLVADTTYTCQNESSFVPSKVIERTKHDSRYEIVKADVSWTQANAQAIQNGGHLVTITSEQEMQFVSQMAANAGLTYVWMGGYTMINNGYCYGHWITGENFEQYQHWYPGEPSRNDRDGTAEKYLILWNVSGEWSWNDERDDPAHDPALSYYLGKVGYVIEYEE